MAYLALLVPAMTLAGLPLIDRLERWAGSPALVVAAVEPGDAGASSPMSSDELE
jgi:hypothetical protein